MILTNHLPDFQEVDKFDGSIVIVWIMRSDRFKPVDINWFLNYTFKALTSKLIINTVIYATQTSSEIESLYVVK